MNRKSRFPSLRFCPQIAPFPLMAAFGHLKIGCGVRRERLRRVDEGAFWAFGVGFQSKFGAGRHVWVGSCSEHGVARSLSVGSCSEQEAGRSFGWARARSAGRLACFGWARAR